MEKQQYYGKAYSELTFTDDFMFCKVLRNNPEICRRLLEILLDIPIEKIEYVEDHFSIRERYDSKGVQLDVYVKDIYGSVFNLEMQMSKQADLPKRMRYYQSMIDMNLLERGARYKALNPSKVIFICPFDYYGQNKTLYRFKNISDSEPTLELGDETEKIVVNINGLEEGLSEDFQELINYFKFRTTDTDFTEQLDEAVKNAVEHREWEVEYMVLSAKMQDLEDEAIERGLAKGLKQGLEQGLEQGIDSGESRLMDAVLKLREGKTEQELIALGFESTTIKRAMILK